MENTEISIYDSPSVAAVVITIKNDAPIAIAHIITIVY